jgi:hypothetical protein
MHAVKAFPLNSTTMAFGRRVAASVRIDESASQMAVPPNVRVVTWVTPASARVEVKKPWASQANESP